MHIRQKQKWSVKCKPWWLTGVDVFVPSGVLLHLPKWDGPLFHFSGTATTWITRWKTLYQAPSLYRIKTVNYTLSKEKNLLQPLNPWAYESTLPTPRQKHSTTSKMNARNFLLKLTTLSVTRLCVWMLSILLLCLRCCTKWSLLNLQNSNGIKLYTQQSEQHATQLVWPRTSLIQCYMVHSFIKG